MDTAWVVKLLSGTVVRGLMWALAGLTVYLLGKGIVAPTPDQSVVESVVTGVLTIALPILAAIWSQKKDKALLFTEPPSKPPA